MAKRGYKLQEFVAHPGSVNSLSIGKKTCRLFVTGGDDHKVNLWSIGKPASLMSLCGHTSSVESVAFDSEEVLVAAGASAGVIKLWDLEETKMVRGLTGHRSSCTAVEFHPFGEFFASGSMDSNLKIWDIRKKGCIHTYKGHTRGISTIRFTPDGRWVVSGGYDNVVKVWDLTAGKLLHDFKYHEGHIRSMDFHPLEFLLATGSADGTVKFWDLETFELIGSTRPEATRVKSITFHPDGRTLFSGFDDGLKVYSWEPVICHDAVDMGWSALSDLCIHDGKLLGFSYYRNSVGVWVADVSRIEPYGAGLVTDEDSYSEKKSNLQDSPLEKVRSHRRSTSNLRSMSPDYETKEIKNIYVDTTGETTIASKKVGSFNTPKVVHSSDSKESGILASQKQRSAAGLHAHAKTIGQGNTKSFTAPIVLPRKSPDRKDTVISRRESIIAGKAASGMPLKPSHTRRPSNTKFEMDRESMAVESCSLQSAGSVLDNMDPNFRSRLVENDDARESSNDKHLNISSVTQKFETTLSPRTPSNHNRDESLDCSKEVDSVKVVRGVTIVTGRTRSLVERFEGRKRSESDEIQTPDPAPAPAPVTVSEAAKTPPTPDSHPLVAGRETVAANDSKIAEEIMQNHDVFLSTLRSRLTKLQVVRHFWERSDIKGAVESMRKLPDNSLQADVVSILMERMEILNLDLFLCLLPVLLGLLNGEIERHANVSLEMLLKLVAVFGPVVHSTISAPPAIGVNLQAEQRLECCNRCFSYLQKIQNILPAIIRRGGLLAKCAQELKLVLQQS